MLCTVQSRPASAYARESPPRGCSLKKQDKTRLYKKPKMKERPSYYGPQEVLSLTNTLQIPMYLEQRRKERKTEQLLWPKGKIG